MAKEFVSRAERWRDIPGHPDYQISDHGRVRAPRRKGSKGGIINGWVRYTRGRPTVRFVALRRDGKTFIERVHRLALLAFVGPCPEGMEGCHNDGDPLNNCLENLRWDTHSNNVADMVAHGTQVAPPTHWGEAHHNAKLTDEQVAEIRSMSYRRGLWAQLARKYGVAQITIRRIHAGLSRNDTRQRSDAKTDASETRGGLPAGL